MRIKRETDHATKCVIHLAKEQGKYISVSELSKQNNIPQSFLAKILQKLNKTGIVESQSGNRGGFRLARTPKEINLREVYDTIQGPISVNQCVIDNKFCERIHFCSVHPVWIDIQRDILKKLEETDFEQLIIKEREIKKSIKDKVK